MALNTKILVFSYNSKHGTVKILKIRYLCFYFHLKEKGKTSMEGNNFAYPKIEGVPSSCYIDAYNLVLDCSQMHTPRSFALRLLDQLKVFCPYDSAVLIFLDANGKLSGTYSEDIPSDQLNLFFSYYLKNMDTLPKSLNFDIYTKLHERCGFQFSQIIRWRDIPDGEFKRDYIDVLGLIYSWGFCFFDLFGAYRVIFSIDRKKERPFSEIEQARLGLALPILNNMHRNFFYQGTDAKEKVAQTPWKGYDFTPREQEIAGLLCQGMTAQNISTALFISIATTYKHITHLFKKAGVNSQQELVAKLLNSKEP